MSFGVGPGSDAQLCGSLAVTLGKFRSSSFLFFGLFWPPLWHMKVPRLGVKWELQLPAYVHSHGSAGPEPHL